MEREETLKRFEPLRKRLGTFRQTTLTTTEQAEATQKAAVVARVSNLTIQDVAGKTSKTRVTLGAIVDGLVGQIDNERINLREVRGVRVTLEGQLEGARDIRTAADAFEVLKQSGEEKHRNLTESFEARQQELQSVIAATKSRWGRQDRERAQINTAEDAQRAAERSADEEEYAYVLNSEKTQQRDAHQGTLRSIGSQLRAMATAKTLELDSAEAGFLVESKDLPELLTRIETLEAAILEEPAAARSARISKINKDAESTAVLTAARRVAEAAILDSQISATTEQVETSAAVIKSLEEQVRAATSQNQELATAAMPSVKDN